MGFKTSAYVVDVRLVNRLPLTSTQPTELARLTQPYYTAFWSRPLSFYEEWHYKN